MWDSPQNPVRFDWESCLYNNSGEYFYLESEVQFNSINFSNMRLTMNSKFYTLQEPVCTISSDQECRQEPERECKLYSDVQCRDAQDTK